MMALNTNNNNSSLQIENGHSFLLGNPFEESCLLEGDLLTASLPAPVIVTEIEPPVEKEHAQLPPTTDVVEPREIPSQTVEEDRQTDVSVVRTRLGFFEQLTSFVIADGVKTGNQKSTAPPVKQDETRVEEKQEMFSDVVEEVVKGRKGAVGRCAGLECAISEEGDHPWDKETRCSEISLENWLQGYQEPSTGGHEENHQRRRFWRPIVENQGHEESSSDESDEETGLVFLPDVTDFNCNNNNATDPESRFKEFIVGGDGFHAYHPSAIAAQAERRPPFDRYIPPASQCRITKEGTPGAPRATEGRPSSKVPANKAGVPWGAKKQRVPSKMKYINQEPYQTLKPSGHWTHGTQQQQPSNKQATSDRQDPFPRYIAKNQKCKARPEFRKKTRDQGIASSAKMPIKKKRRAPINLDAVRCNCPGLYPVHPSHGPGNYWDEEDDDEAILAEMCPGDDLEECGQGVDNVFPLEEWADEWEDGVLSGDCLRGGKLAPGTLDLLPWENPCLEELYKRKARIQDLRNKRWAALDKAKAEAKRMKDEAGEGEGADVAKQEAAKQALKDLTKKALNEHGQKSWSLLSWFTPTKWAEADCNDCATVNRPGKTCTTRTSSGPNVCSPRKGNKCSNNIYGEANASSNAMTEEAAVDPPKADLATEAMAEYEWDQVEESDEEYSRRITESQTKVNIEERKRRLQRFRNWQRLAAEKELQASKREEAPKEIKDQKKGRGVLSSMFGLFGGNESRNNSGGNANNTSDDLIMDVGGKNVNNNAANRCFRPCPPCPQEECEPPPFECPCNDIHCPKKLKANKDNVQKKDVKTITAGVGNIDVSIDVTDDLKIEGIDISVKKPPPDLSLGCPCGDEECKRKVCDPPKERVYEVCEPRYGKMALQEACPVQECERDICDKDDEPKECPCTDDNCPKKSGSQEGFVFLYPPTDKIKLDDNGCPTTTQMHCVVTQIGDNPPQVAVKPVALKSLHCEPVPPCPCPEWEAMEQGSCLCSGNAWGEEIGDEALADCGKKELKKENSKECGGSTAEGGVTGDDFEWDFWDSPCDEVSASPEATAEDLKACQEYVASRNASSDNKSAAIEAALEAFEYEKVRKERMKTEAETRKRRVEEMKELGMSEEEIVDQLCSDRVPGPCEIMGEFPPQEACAPNPPPPGCPCPDPACPKRAFFDYQMRDMDLEKIKNPYDRANMEKYLQSDAFKTMDCELKFPTYKDVNKTYPKREKNRCPCPECVTEEQKAWAAVQKLKIGPPPDCPCKDPKCPKKPQKAAEKTKEESEDKGPCAMETYYPAQSGCPEVLRCDLLKHPCGKPECGEEPKKPEERYRCHTCSIRTPMPKQAACPDYDCQDCKLVCHICACKPKKCDKCEDADRQQPTETLKEPCPPCTVAGPLPKQTGCKEIHPCDKKHPCMCNPSSGEPIDAERCGPCDTINHDIYPNQGGCPYTPKDGGIACELGSSSNAESSSFSPVDDENQNSNLAQTSIEDDQTTANNDNEAFEESVSKLKESLDSAVDKDYALPVSDHIPIENEGTTKEEPTGESKADVVQDLSETKEEANAETKMEIKAVCASVEEQETLEVVKRTGDEGERNVVEKEENMSRSNVENKVKAIKEATEMETEGAYPEITEETAEATTEEFWKKVAEVPEEKTIDAQDSEKGVAEESFVDVKKGTRANVKVEFRVVGLELSDDELKAVGEAFDKQEVEEAAVSKNAMEEELKRAALEAVKEKMKIVAPISEPNEAAPEAVEVDSFNEVDDPFSTSCSFTRMEISAFLPAFLRPKAKCRPQPRKQIEQRYRASLKPTERARPPAPGLNVIEDLGTQRRGVIHRASQLRTPCEKRSKISGAFGRNFLAKKHELVLVNNDDGAIDIIKFDQLSEKSQSTIDQMIVPMPKIEVK